MTKRAFNAWPQQPESFYKKCSRGYGKHITDPFVHQSELIKVDQPRTQIKIPTSSYTFPFMNSVNPIQSNSTLNSRHTSGGDKYIYTNLVLKKLMIFSFTTSVYSNNYLRSKVQRFHLKTEVEKLSPSITFINFF